MARLSDQLIDRIKQEVSLIRLVESKGFTLKPHGSDYVMCCPFHEDDTASLVITPSKNLWHCMGACQEGGSVIDWVMKTEGVSFRHAVELLQNEFLPLAAENTNEPKVIKQNSKQKLPTPLVANADHQETLRQVIDYYHETLKQSPEALEYLESRGLKNAELIDTFKLGFANRTLAYRLPQKNRQAGAAIRGKLQAIGILRESGHEHFNGSIVIPVLDEHGIITEVYGRKLLGKRLRKGTAIHTYLPGPHQGVWNSQAVKASNEIILCESLIDAMTFWCAGFRNVTASYGTSGFTDDHLKRFIGSHVEKVLIAYDRDEAGNTAADKLAKKLTDNGMDVYRVLFPKGMDANEYAKQVTPAQKSLSLAIRKAEWVGNGENKRQSDVITVDQSVGNRLEQPQVGPEGVEGRTPGIKKQVNETKSKNEPENYIPLAAPGIVPPATLAPPCASAAPGVPPPATTAAENEIITTDVPADVSEHEVVMILDNRHYRIRGLTKNLSYEQLKINILIKEGDASDAQGCANVAGGRMPGAYHVDTFNIYSARHRASYIKQAAQELTEGSGLTHASH